jgi:hypothetical protein
MSENHPHPQPLSTSVSTNNIPDTSPSDTSSLSEVEEETSPQPHLSTIYLHITTPLLIHGNNNRVTIDTAANAIRISEGVVSALRSMCGAGGGGSGDGGGIPMIDEDGRPRPIKVEVRAETRVVGSGNLVSDRIQVIGRKEEGGKEGNGVKEVNGDGDGRGVNGVNGVNGRTEMNGTNGKKRSGSELAKEQARKRRFGLGE